MSAGGGQRLSLVWAATLEAQQRGQGLRGPEGRAKSLPVARRGMNGKQPLGIFKQKRA